MNHALAQVCAVTLVMTSALQSNAVDKPRIQKVWVHREYSDPNNNHLKYLRLDADLLESLSSKVDSRAYSYRLWHADINNDGRPEYIFVRTPHNTGPETHSSGPLEKVGPVFEYTNGEVKELKLPAIPFEYTGVLEPFLEYGKQGLRMNLHHTEEVSPNGKVSAKGESERDSFVLSRRVALMWRGDSIKIVKENFLCNETPCSKKQLFAIKRTRNL